MSLTRQAHCSGVFVQAGPLGLWSKVLQCSHVIVVTRRGRVLGAPHQHGCPKGSPEVGRNEQEAERPQT